MKQLTRNLPRSIAAHWVLHCCSSWRLLLHPAESYALNSISPPAVGCWKIAMLAANPDISCLVSIAAGKQGKVIGETCNGTSIGHAGPAAVRYALDSSSTVYSVKLSRDSVRFYFPKRPPGLLLPPSGLSNSTVQITAESLFSTERSPVERSRGGDGLQQ